MRLTWTLILGLACAKQPAPTLAGPGARGFDGRWVAENLPVAYHFRGDSVEPAVYPPQAPAPPTWTCVGDSVRVADANGRATSHGFTIRGDTLEINWPLATQRRALIRIAGTPGPDLTGSWRGKTAREVLVATFRTDGRLVPEMGVPPWFVLRLDTLRLEDGRPNSRLLVRRAGDHLELRNIERPQMARVKLIRRPWGCFGIKELDRDAKECR